MCSGSALHQLLPLGGVLFEYYKMYIGVGGWERKVVSTSAGQQSSSGRSVFHRALWCGVGCCGGAC